MSKVLADLSAREFETLVERTIDRRLEIWMTQLIDAMLASLEEENMDLTPEFAASLKRSLEQAQAGEGVNLETFRAQLER